MDVGLIQKRTYIDIWWLSDDGGWTILLPHLLKQNEHWRNHKLRIRPVCKSIKHMVSEELRMSRLLRKFRLEADIVPVLLSDSSLEAVSGPDSPYRKIFDFDQF